MTTISGYYNFKCYILQSLEYMKHLMIREGSFDISSLECLIDKVKFTATIHIQSFADTLVESGNHFQYILFLQSVGVDIDYTLEDIINVLHFNQITIDIQGSDLVFNIPKTMEFFVKNGYLPEPSATTTSTNSTSTSIPITTFTTSVHKKKLKKNSQINNNINNSNIKSQ
ncbi:hypothetical protein CYY_008101 [Polysphondylium violaceum]|uniref:Uncharacterized protein n=1 Tax=Polysphondylium violaceum TaxID=133409 RepID=A0A8J4PP49_9MYCE|nr:hypothetical protein CYY_008101 [Polysphondylium violaceum]